MNVIYRDSGAVAPVVSGNKSDAYSKMSLFLGSAANDIFKTQLRSATLSFQNTLDSAREEAYQNNQTDPDGFLSQYRAMVGAWQSKNPALAKNAQFKEAIRRDETKAIAAIAENLKIQERANLADRVKENFASVLATQSVSAGLFADDFMREFAASDLKQTFESTLFNMSSRDPAGRFIMKRNGVNSFVYDWNRGSKLGTINGHIRSMIAYEDMENFEKRLQDGEIRSMQFTSKFDEKNGYTLDKVFEKKIDHRDPDVVAAIKDAKYQMRKAFFWNHEGPIIDRYWKSGEPRTDGVLLTQTSVDRYCEDHPGLFQGATAEERMAKITRFARAVGRLPTQVKDAITGAVHSGDPDAIAVSVEFAKALNASNNLDVLFTLFSDDQTTLGKLFSLSEATSTLGTTEMDVRKTILAGGRQIQRDERVDILVDEAFNRTLDYFPQWGGAEISDEDKYFLRGELEQFLNKTNGDIPAAALLLKSLISNYKKSRLMGGTVTQYPLEKYVTPAQLMPFSATEDFADVPTESTIRVNGKRFFEESLRAGIIPYGAKLMDTQLTDWDFTEDTAKRLEAAFRTGLRYYTDENGNEILSPTYMIMGKIRGVTGEVYYLPLGPFRVERTSNGR
jgi:hypothetical protein